MQNQMTKLLKKPSSCGEALLKKKGPKYFSKLAKKGWDTRRANIKKWEAQNK